MKHSDTFLFNEFQLSQRAEYEVITVCLTMLVGMAFVFFPCYFGKLATESFEKMNNCLYDINWPDLPIDLQKSLIMMITNAQIPLYYHGFGMVHLKLETFCKVRI